MRRRRRRRLRDLHVARARVFGGPRGPRLLPREERERRRRRGAIPPRGDDGALLAVAAPGRRRRLPRGLRALPARGVAVRVRELPGRLPRRRDVGRGRADGRPRRRPRVDALRRREARERDDGARLLQRLGRGGGPALRLGLFRRRRAGTAQRVDRGVEPRRPARLGQRRRRERRLLVARGLGRAEATGARRRDAREALHGRVRRREPRAAT